MQTEEANFDGLVGPTHNYAGLAPGNVASLKNAKMVSNPREAALQGLLKMKFLMTLGIPQAVMPPHERPNIPLLRSLGFTGNDKELVQQVYKASKYIFTVCFSSANMWTANAATVAPSFDTQDHRLHISPANLITHLHRAQEVGMHYQVFKKIFADETKFKVHEPLPLAQYFGDEGAANHNRFVENHDDSGVQLFVYDREAGGNQWGQSKYPARQTLEASQAIARRHRLTEDNIIFAKQNQMAIEQGVFHNDVISLGHRSVFLYHEDAFENTDELIGTLKKKAHFPLFLIPVLAKEFSIADAVQTYLFNSQLITKQNGSMMLLVPEECRLSERAHYVLSRIIEEDNPIKSFTFIDCRQSMQNGGGPACLRLRIVLSEAERKSCLASVFLDEVLYQRLVDCVTRRYRDRLAPEDLLDPLLIEESQETVAELTQILGLGHIYSFQK